MIEDPLAKWIKQLRFAIEAPDAYQQICEFFTNIEADIYNRALSDIETCLRGDISAEELKTELLSMRLNYHGQTSDESASCERGTDVGINKTAFSNIIQFDKGRKS